MSHPYILNGLSTPVANPGDIVVIATEGLDELQVHALLTALGSVGYKGAIAGIEIPKPEVQQPGSDYLTDEVRDWRDTYGMHIETKYLDEIVLGDNPTVTRLMFTEQAIKAVFVEMFGSSNSTSISSGQVNHRIIGAINRTHGRRDYVQDGTLFLGKIKKPGYYNPQE